MRPRNVAPSRKDKSLGVLCERFLEHIDVNQPNIICLDNMAQILKVERRRIYDIVNVLESVEILSRVCKNQYQWHGFNNLHHTLSKLKTLAVKSNFLEYTKTLMASSLDLHQDSKQALNVYYEQRQELPGSQEKFTGETKDECTQTITISREEKSLGIMAQKFLMLFLTAEDGLVSINFAARVLLGDSKNDITELGRFKTKIRRLYDIANVLSSIKLIKKYTCIDSHISKPAYKYNWQPVEVIRDAEYVFDFMNAGNPLSNSKHSLFDHFKRNLDQWTNIPKFDVKTGILKSKNDFQLPKEKRLKRGHDSAVSPIPTNKIKKEETNHSYPDVELSPDYQSNASPQSFAPFLFNHHHQQQMLMNEVEAQHFMMQHYAQNELYLPYHHEIYNQHSEHYLHAPAYHTLQNMEQYPTLPIVSNNSLSSTSASEYSDSGFFQHISSTAQNNSWADESGFVDSVSPLSSVAYLPSFNTFLNSSI